MNKVYKGILIFGTFTIVAGTAMYQHHNEAYNFSAKGTVVEARWNTKNHQMSLFVIKEKLASKKLHHAQVILEPNQIKVGDNFLKEAASKFCKINGVIVQCVN